MAETTRKMQSRHQPTLKPSSTVRLDGVKQEDYGTVFYPGGHRPMWDLAKDKELDQFDRVVRGRRQVHNVGLPPSRRALHVKTREGKPLVEGKNLTGFTSGEEEEVELTKVVPFLVEDELMSFGAHLFVKNWGAHTIVDGQLITGRNPASSGPTARVLIETLNRNAKSARHQTFRAGSSEDS